MKREKAIIDGSNAVYLQAPRVPRPNVKNILAVADAVESSGRDAIIIMDPTIRSLFADLDEFEQLLSDRRVMVVPGGEDISHFVLTTADKLNAVIVSNNTYIDYFEEFPWIETRRIPVAINNGSVLLLEHKLKLAS
jgi:Zc3h12a-like Ribonuclease NYN domain